MRVKGGNSLIITRYVASLSGVVDATAVGVGVHRLIVVYFGR